MAFEKKEREKEPASAVERLSRELLAENIQRLRIIGLIGLPLNLLLVGLALLRDGQPGLARPDTVIRYLWILATLAYLAITRRVTKDTPPGKFLGGVFIAAAMLCAAFASGITVYSVSSDTASLVYIVVVLLVGAFLFLDSATFMIIVTPALVLLYIGVLSQSLNPSRVIAVLVNITAMHVFAAFIVVFNLRLKEAQFASEEEKRALHEEIKALSELDGLTGIPNRRKIAEIIDFWKAVYARKPDSLGIIMIDMDWFKNYNDVLDHLAGDDVLRKTASIIRTCLFREADFVGRYGGDEFIVFLPGITRLGAFTIAERVRMAVEDASLAYQGDHCSAMTVSCGISFTEFCSREAFDALMQLSDLALSDAKQAGRNRVIIRDMF